MPAQQKRGLESAEDGDPMENHRENGHEDPPQEEESDRSRSTESSEDDEKDEYVAVRLSEIRKEVQCPICLGIIRKTRTVMECLHRFCRECIDKSMRLGNNECPACRTHCASRRSLRDDPKYDALIAAIYPDIDKYEEEELSFHEEEKARNKQIQASIAQTFRRQSEALGRKRTTAKATAAAFMRRSQGNYKMRRRRNHKNTFDIQGSDVNEEGNGNDGGKDSSSADEQLEPRPKRPKRWAGARYYQPSSATANADGDDENDYEVNKAVMAASVGFIGSPERLAWGKGGMRSHTRYGSSSGANGKNARNRLSKLVEYLRNSEANDKGLDIHLLLVSFDEQRIPSLQRPYLCCRPTLSVGQLCQYVAEQTALQPDEVEIYLLKELQAKVNTSDPTNAAVSTSGVLDSSKDTLLLLRDNESLAEVQARHLTRGHLLLAYQKKWNLNRG
ncbi:putative E3 ubiquitin-protein ligase RING1a isoform X1 [Argentina anserina]|uniref:putative E3 ubiquitin-protein ligase RING1a isoform X1 n=2 Tax=Argentina anserina TaxID=57926 RepID=UPI002176846E|nr:putative E3 ubiquitin-protein ligase RING1a isoform X1 [Potentilla anserina]